MVHLSTDLTDENDKALETWAEGLQKLKLDGEIVSIIHSKTDRKANVLQVDEMRVLYGNDYYMDKIDDLEFKIGPMSFFQTNTKGAEVLYNTALEYAENAEKVFDLYSGTGTIASLLSKKAKNIYAVELVEEAVQAAKENAEKNGINNVEFHDGDVKEIVEKLPEPDYVVVDPPRAGLHKNVVKYLNNKKFDKIIYVSCNPTTLAENLRDMKKVYKVKELTFMDMFPHTRHVETVVLMSKK
jgi:23S rRNA (uracil-5-)-methyltransferase RumA